MIDAFNMMAVIVLLLSIALAVFCYRSIAASSYRGPLLALFGAPLFVLLIEVGMFPSNLDGVTSLTGIFTMMYCIVWVPIWILVFVVASWRSAPPSP